MSLNLIKLIQQLEIKTDKRSVWTFGIGLGIIFVLFGGFHFWLRETFHSWLFIAGGSVWLATLIYHRSLLVVYYPWMLVTKLLGMGITYVLLTLTFYLILVPIGVILRLKGNDPLKRDWGGSSYWEDRENETDKRMNRMF